MLEFIIILLLLSLNGFFAMSEIALVSSKKLRLEDIAQKGSHGAKIALKLLEEPEKFLSTIQIGITLVGIVAGVYGGIAIAKDVQPYIEKLGVSKFYADDVSIIFVVSLITYLSLVIGELVPKTIALNNAEAIAIKVASVMLLLAIFARPVVFILSFSTKVILKILSIKQLEELPVTEEELKLMIEQGRRHGVLESKESEMMKGIFRFGDRRAYSIMTNRQDILWLDVNDDIETNRKIIYSNIFSKYPVCSENLDNLLGVIHVKDFLKKYAADEKFEMKDIITQPLILPDNIPAVKVLEKFIETKTYITIVVDEYGSIKGMITLHDLIENIFGELPDTTPGWESAIFKRSDGSLLIDGSIQIDELKELLSIEFEGEEHYTTLGGFVMYKVNSIPKLGDRLNAGGYQFEVVDMDGKRVDKVLVNKIPVNK